jgi:hypothetical protein
VKAPAAVRPMAWSSSRLVMFARIATPGGEVQVFLILDRYTVGCEWSGHHDFRCGQHENWPGGGVDIVAVVSRFSGHRPLV